MNRKLTDIIVRTLLLTLASAPAFAIEPETGLGKRIKSLLSDPSCHECVLEAIYRSYVIDAINARRYPNDDNQQSIYEVSMLLVESGNPANAVRCASDLIDWDKKYEIAEALIRSGNPRNGVKCLMSSPSVPEEYIIRGIALLKESGNPGNARILEDYLRDLRNKIPR